MPARIFSMLAGEWYSSPSTNRQPSLEASSEPIVDFPEPATPMTIITMSSSSGLVPYGGGPEQERFERRHVDRTAASLSSAIEIAAEHDLQLITQRRRGGWRRSTGSAGADGARSSRRAGPGCAARSGSWSRAATARRRG